MVDNRKYDKSCRPFISDPWLPGINLCSCINRRCGLHQESEAICSRIASRWLLLSFWYVGCKPVVFARELILFLRFIAPNLLSSCRILIPISDIFHNSIWVQPSVQMNHSYYSLRPWRAHRTNTQFLSTHIRSASIASHYCGFTRVPVGPR